ncbi:hypothetical protein [Jeotgalibacillus aurantiacus]|uniref:hypothetical protein n=1 Tax=Jeotgalibacillus aurantiacus TaxID=2763266 RepID=UPI001D09DCDE|nr:hypothetical protein [Jeotgalibacillus aurantiacus]
MKRIASLTFSFVAFSIILLANFQSGVWFDTETGAVLNSICIAAMILCVILIVLNARKRNKDTSI